jgi:hypothetical protein
MAYSDCWLLKIVYSATPAVKRPGTLYKTVVNEIQHIILFLVLSYILLFTYTSL